MASIIKPIVLTMSWLLAGWIVSAGGQSEPMCSDLPSIQNGVISYSTGSTTNTRPVGIMATYSCTMVYSLVGDGVRICRNDGQWSGSPPSCQITTAVTSPTTVTTVTARAPAEPPTIYLSLGETNITTNNTEVLITDIGQDDTTSLTCQTDLTACCRVTDGSSTGEWYYPDGSVVPNNASGYDFARVRNAPQLVRLYRRIPPATTSPTGLYCCVVPTTVGKQTFCADLVTSITATTTTPTTDTTVASTDVPTVVMCPTLSVLDNGMITYSPTNSPTSVGTMITYQCNVGYILIGVATRTCGSSGVWSGEASTCEVTPPVYFSLSSTNYITNNSEILHSSVGEGPGNYFTCHTDLSNCCRGLETGASGVGAWHYPDGSVIPTASSGGGDIYSNRDAAMGINLNRRPDVAGPNGLYCCVIPTSTGTQTLCANLVSMLTTTQPPPTNQSPSTESTGPTSVVDCGPLSAPTNGLVLPSGTTLNSEATYNCDSGYQLSGSRRAVCMSSGVWGPTAPTCVLPPVYLSLSSTNYVSSASEIPLTSVGEGPGNYLTCHTDLPNCCRNKDTGMGGVGVWHYPNGSVIPTASSGGGDFYSNRNAPMVIRLNRRPGVASPTGLYCCVIPTSTGTDVSCINLVAPISGSTNTGATVGASAVVVILGLAVILAVTAVIIAYFVLKQRRMGGVDLNALGQSSPPQTDETVDVTYEEIDKPRPLKGNFELSQCEAYATTTHHKGVRGRGQC